MIVYQAWIEIVDAQGNYSTLNFRHHLKKNTAMFELHEKVECWGKEGRVVIIRKGIKEIEVVE